jgi:hypothetical protein
VPASSGPVCCGAKSLGEVAILQLLFTCAFARA